jgi:tetratricopeptide (TPR) repeat protein
MNTARAWMVIALVLGVVATGARAIAQIESETPAVLFARGNAAYEAGDYARAIDEYTRVVDAGVSHTDLAYNLGNAYFKQGDLGQAILWYERAHRFAPREADVRENLDLTRSLLRDQQLLPSEPRWRATLLSWHRDTTAAESTAAASVLYALLCLVGVCFVFRESEAISRAYARISVLSPGRLFGLDKAQDLGLAIAVVAIIAGAFGYSAMSKVRAESSRAIGIVLAEEVSVFSGPSREASVQFKVHEGTRVRVSDARPGWVRVDLPGDLTGWIDESSLDRI